MSDLPEEVYSLDEEWFEDLDTIQGQVDDGYEPGEKISGFKGVLVPVSHLDILKEAHSIIELIQETASDIDGDLADDYLTDVTEEIEDGLLEVMAKYLDDNVKTPQYYRVGEIIECVFTSRIDDE